MSKSTPEDTDMRKLERCTDNDTTADTSMNLAREDFRKYLVKHTECNLQDNWPCGTCATSLLSHLGVHEVGEHNVPIDSLNEFWRGILQIRQE